MKLLPCLLLLTAVSSGSSISVTNVPSADTYFETYGSDDKNFGSQPVLKIDQWGGRQAFLRFSVENVPKDKQLLRAILRLRIADVGFNEQGEFADLKTCIGLFDVATTWTENGLTYKTADGKTPWNQGPGIQGGKYTDVGPLPKPDVGVNLARPAIALAPSDLKKDAWLELDLTDFIKTRLRSGTTEINLVMRSSTLGRNLTFSSREDPEASHRPQLIVEASDTVPVFSLPDQLLTGWKSVQPVPLLPSGLGTDSPVLWVVTQKPVRSEQVTVRVQDEKAILVADAPGSYTVQLNLVKGGAIEANETARINLLSVPAHPRLYVTPKDLERMRREASEGARLTKAFLKWVEAGATGAEKGKFHDMGMHDGCENTALAWLITGDRVQLSNSIAYARLILQKPMREHFEDVHSATFLGASWVHAMALHYDWCYEQLEPSHRRAVAEWLKEAASWGWVRSGAPIAHNDGGARQCLLGSAALALLGDDPDAPAMWRRSVENFENNLLPWLNDGGQGGRCGDGGEYEGLHGFYIVKYAWMTYTGTGWDVFSESPFFANRLKHVLFSWYPRPLVERKGAFSMREYYSPSGDHTRLGYVGDTQPYQSAAALCWRYRDTPDAQAVRWLAGDWPTAWMQYTLRWAVLGGFEAVPQRRPEQLAYLDPGCNTAYMRSDWSDDATWVLFENAPFVSAHDSLDSGTFEIFKGDILAARTGNMDHANVGSSHCMNYLHRTIAGNCLLIHDPDEKWKGFLGGAEGSNDGGGERTNFPLTSSPDADTYLTYKDIFRRGRVVQFQDSKLCTFVSADLTAAYNNPRFHGGNLNQAKVSNVTRELMYLRPVDSILVFDRIASLTAEHRKTWLLHSLGELEVSGGTERRIDDGEFHYSGANRAVIRYGWPKPVPSFGRCLSVTLLPENPELIKIGGRVELPAGTTESFPGDQWHGQHQHRHLKDFWVNGKNYPPGNPPETRWFGEPGTQWYVPGTPDESGGRGKWRLEVSPTMPGTNTTFFHVLCPRLGREGDFPSIDCLQGGDFEGALVTDNGSRVAVFFSNRDGSAELNSMIPGEAPCSLVVADFPPGEYSIRSDAGSSTARVDLSSPLLFGSVRGKTKISRR